MKYLTPQQILAIHDQMIKRFGGSNGIRDIGLLESAAALLHSLLKKITHSLTVTNGLRLHQQVFFSN